MKKSLLLASTIALAFGAMAETDGNTYAPVDGYTFTSVAANRARTTADPSAGAFSALVGKAFPSLDYVRTGTMLNGKVYVGSSKTAGADGSLLDQGLLVIFDATTGEYEKSVQLTVGGAPLEGLLCANSIGHDESGNLWICGYKGTMWATSEANPEGSANPLRVYSVDPETGVCTLQAELGLTEDDRGATGRVDFIDVAGDITRKNGRCVIMAVPSAADNTYVYCWAAAQGKDFTPGFLWDEDAETGEYTVLTIDKENLYPQLDNFNGGTTVNIVADENQYFDNFYVDDMNCAPGLYNSECSLVQNFATVKNPADLPEGEKGLIPGTNPSGANEFSFGEDIFLMYGIEEYGDQSGTEACRANLVKLGEGGDFATMKQLYRFPADGLGVQKGGPGARVHNFEAEVVTDANGKHAAHIFTYKTGNGWAHYLFAEAGFDGAGVAAVEIDNNAPVEYFNLQGIRVANPENGIFIRRQGNTAGKVYVK